QPLQHGRGEEVLGDDVPLEALVGQQERRDLGGDHEEDEADHDPAGTHPGLGPGDVHGRVVGDGCGHDFLPRHGAAGQPSVIGLNIGSSTSTFSSSHSWAISAIAPLSNMFCTASKSTGPSPLSLGANIASRSSPAPCSSVWVT